MFNKDYSAVRTDEGNAEGGNYSAVRTNLGNAEGGYNSAVRTDVGNAEVGMDGVAMGSTVRIGDNSIGAVIDKEGNITDVWINADKGDIKIHYGDGNHEETHKITIDGKDIELSEESYKELKESLK